MRPIYSAPQPLTDDERELMRLLGMMRPLLNREGEIKLNQLERRALTGKTGA